MAPESAESKIIEGDFAGNRLKIARENSPFGPVIAGLVQIEIPTDTPQEPTPERWRRISHNSRQLEATNNPDFYDF